MTPISLAVTHHAMWRAKERFPEFDTVEIEDEVWAAFAKGRVSKHRPTGLNTESASASLYVWTPDGQRVYALRHTPGRDDNTFVVTTTLRAAP